MQLQMSQQITACHVRVFCFFVLLLFFLKDELELRNIFLDIIYFIRVRNSGMMQSIDPKL